MNRQNIYYRMKDGNIICNGELEDAFYYTHGYRRSQNEPEFLRFLLEKSL